MGMTLLLVAGALVVYNLRMWLMRSLTKHHHKQHLRLHLLIIGVVSTLIVLGFPKILPILGINSEQFKNTINHPTLLINALYILISASVFFVLYAHRILSKKGLLTRGTFLLLYVVLSNVALVLGAPGVIMYFMIVVFGEEFIKYTFGYSLFKTFKIHFSDILLFSLLSGFAFACVENAVYGRYSIQGTETISWVSKITLFAKTFLQRGLINVVVHGLFTALIGWLSLNIFHPKRTYSTIQIIGKMIVAVIVGMGVHLLFNTLQIKGITIIIPIVVLGGYIFVSYLTFKSDTIFRP